MLKLKHLFHNRDLVDMLIGYWDCDAASREVMDRFRISANAVYPFYHQEQLQFLRFSPEEEKSAELIRAEIDFLNYLKESGYPAVRTVLSRSGKELINVPTPWGQYTAVVFTAVNGTPLTELDYSDELYYGMGQSLAHLHTEAAAYQPVKSARPDWKERLDWCRNVFERYQAPKKAVLELVVLRKYFSALPATPYNYGLVHYDFERDSVFFDPQQQLFTPIDFDDSHYHWFVMDVVKTIRNIQEELPDHDKDRAAQSMMSGYQSVKGIDEDMLARSEMFVRYMNIFMYARIWRSIYEEWEHEPEWMTQLREQLKEHLKLLEGTFSG